MEVLTISECARQLGLDRNAVAVLIDANEITTHPCPHNGNGKVIDAEALDALRPAAANIRRRRAQPLASA